jgi:hypothetical protein
MTTTEPRAMSTPPPTLAAVDVGLNFSTTV